MIDCRLLINGVEFADQAADLSAGVPTALADLEMTWGRSTTVDQPDAATCRVAVLDRSGGGNFIDLLPIGGRLTVWASGDVGMGAPTDIVVDGGFETLPPGDPGLRIEHTGLAPTFVASITTDRPHADVQSMRFDQTIPGGTNSQTAIPPATFDLTDPSAWDAIPGVTEGQTWQWSGALFPARYGTMLAAPRLFLNPHPALGWGPFSGVQATGDGAWHVVGGDVVIPSGHDGEWVGVLVWNAVAQWVDVPTTWQAAPDTWRNYQLAWVDDLAVISPADELTRHVLIFAGRITDLGVAIDDDEGTVRAEVTAVDQLAELQNRYVGDEPWPAEALAARVNRVLTAAGLATAVDVLIDPPLDAAVLSWRDVDSQPVGGLFAEWAAGLDGVLWSAVHATTGAYLWFEDPANRSTLGVLALQDGVVVIVSQDTNRAGRTVLDGCRLDVDGVTWRRDVTDVLTRVDAAWLEQTLDETGNPAPTERTVRVVDSAAEQAYGARRMGITTPLTTAAAATDVAERILNRVRQPQWRVDGLEYNLGQFPPAPGADTATALDLLDGTTRLGRGLIIENTDLWPTGEDTVGMYLDGGRYLFDGAWTLGLAATPMAGFGQSGPWTSLDPTWRWNQMDPDIDWADLYGVTGPVTSTTKEAA